MPKPMNITIEGNRIRLQRDQWQGNSAYISNYPGLLDEIKKHTWTYTDSGHPYLNCSALKISLHKFVLQFLYGEEKLDEMLGSSNVIEHLDNNGLNCVYENLHVLSADMNKAKAFSIDKKNATLESGEITDIPVLITDVYYVHEGKYFQLQVFFNKNICLNPETNNIAETVIFHYDDFDNLFIDWLYCFECIKGEKFDISKHHAIWFKVIDATFLNLMEDENNAAIIMRDGKYYIRLGTDPENGPLSYMVHTAFRKIEDSP